MIGLFRRIILEANIEKSKKMVFQPGVIWYGMSAEAFARRGTEEGASCRDRLRLQIPCPKCGVEVTAGTLADHRIRMHGTKPEIKLDLLPVS